MRKQMIMMIMFMSIQHIHLLINEIIKCFDEQEDKISGDGKFWFCTFSKFKFWSIIKNLN